LPWIFALAKARSAVPISAAISAKRATPASAKINATLEGARQKGTDGVSKELPRPVLGVLHV